MAYNATTGVYTSVSGATSATAGQTIASATWDSIHSDISTALTSLGVGMIPLTASVSPSALSEITTPPVVLVNFAATAGADIATINLPLPPTASGWRIDYLKIYNASANLNSPTVALYTAANAGGTQVLSSTGVTVATSLPNGANSQQTITSSLGSTLNYSGAQVFLHVTASTGSATGGTASVTISYEPSF